MSASTRITRANPAPTASPTASPVKKPEKSSKQTKKTDQQVPSSSGDQATRLARVEHMLDALLNKQSQPVSPVTPVQSAKKARKAASKRKRRAQRPVSSDDEDDSDDGHVVVSDDDSDQDAGRPRGELNQFISSTVRAPATDQPRLTLRRELGYTLSKPMKMRIWKGQFIEFYELWSKMKQKQPERMSMKMSDGEVYFQTNKVKQIRDLDTWTQVFCTYMAIIVQREPEKASGLITYMAKVREGALEWTGDWVEYDREFRLQQHVEPDRSWGEFDSHLWTMTMGIKAADKAKTEYSVTRSNSSEAQTSKQTPANTFKSTGGNKKYAKTSKPAGKCFYFNTDKGCSRGSSCTFEHTCNNCQSLLHPILRCPKLAKN